MVLSFSQGLRIQDFKDVCPWEILEGVKNSGPLMLSWFGAVRMKRKPLKFEEQRHLVRFHAHQTQFQNFITGPHTVKLPSEEQVPMGPPAMPEGDKTSDIAQNDASKPPRTISISGTVTGRESGDQGGGGVAGTLPHPSAAAAAGGSGMVPVGPAPRHQEHYPPGIRPMMMTQRPQPQYVTRPATMNAEQMRQAQLMKETLNKIKRDQMAHMAGVMPPPMYPGMATQGIPMSSYTTQMRRQQQLQVMQQHHQFQQQKRMHMMRVQQQQQQQMHQQQILNQQYGSYQAQQAQQAPGMHAMRAAPMQATPMQANPPMQMQQVMQQQSRQGYPAAMMTPGRQPPQMQYPPQQAQAHAGMTMQPRPGMY